MSVNTEQLQKATERLRAHAAKQGQGPAKIDAALQAIMPSGSIKATKSRTSRVTTVISAIAGIISPSAPHKKD